MKLFVLYFYVYSQHLFCEILSAIDYKILTYKKKNVIMYEKHVNKTEVIAAVMAHCTCANYP